MNKDGWGSSTRELSRLRKEIIRVGRKLWARQYVDGSGGNISARYDSDKIICTPSLCSKGDLTPEDLVLIDMEGKQIAGTGLPSSEILLHLEIYRAIPRAGGVIHCHPPHAMAYAITGSVPPANLVPEYEVFIGNLALVPYETPGTPEFAGSVKSYLTGRSMLLLQNHGTVCWADTVSQAEWMVEVLDAYCHSLILAAHLNRRLVPIPEAKLEELRKIRERLGLACS